MKLLHKEITLANDINGRQAANFVYTITSKPFNIWITKEDRQVNGKSILGLLSLNLSKNDVVIITISDNNEQEINDIGELINN